MQIPMVSSSNLYQYLTVLGFTLICLCVYGVGQTASGVHDDYSDYLGNYRTAENDHQKELWNGLIKQQSSNASFVIRFFSFFALVGFGLFVFGGVIWYRKYQWYEDKKLDYDNQLKEIETELAALKLKKEKTEQEIVLP